MALPGFTAETSLGPTVQIYRVLAHPVVAGLGHLFPQQYDGDADLEGAELAREVLGRELSRDGGGGLRAEVLPQLGACGF